MKLHSLTLLCKCVQNNSITAQNGNHCTFKLSTMLAKNHFPIRCKIFLKLVGLANEKFHSYSFIKLKVKFQILMFPHVCANCMALYVKWKLRNY